MNVLSLFDGMSCGQIALNRCGINYDNYYASEIDKYAIQVTMANYPNTIQIGDVSKVEGSYLPKIDLLIGGSPCQGFSFAGKGLNFEDERSKLFFEYIRLLKECQPKYFLLENVKMRKEHEQVISNFLKCRPIRFDSGYITAQQRNRLYWTNISVTDIPQKKYEKIEDILDKTEDRFMSEKGQKYAMSAKYRKDRPSNILKKVGALQSQREECILIEGKIRNLSPLEYERLQTVPDGYTAFVSNAQRKKMLGNGWTIDVICWILNFIK